MVTSSNPSLYQSLELKEEAAEPQRKEKRGRWAGNECQEEKVLQGWAAWQHPPNNLGLTEMKGTQKQKQKSQDAHQQPQCFLFF